MNLMWDSLPKLLDGAFLTLELIILALVIGFILAVPVALMRTAKNPFLWGPAYGYIFYFRGTPLLVQIYLTYYGLGQFEAVRESFLWPIFREAYWCAIIAFSLNTAAYTAEIFRGAIQ
ncbi:MAG: ABC transporter permease subunit, partial [Alphaproteobacteria bacterium]|nr:ABC transporter permease subunit [Alphaproteobacteria bacterium]